MEKKIMNGNNQDKNHEPGIKNKIIAEFEKIAVDGDYIPQEIYDSLPSLLKDSCSVFNDKDERAVYLTGALSVLGGCFHNLSAFHEVDKKEVATNLQSIIVAPSASGKGALNYSRKLAQDIKKTFATNSKKPLSGATNKLIIPANISSSGLIQLLHRNKGVGVMVETEIDTIVNANRQEWGNYSEIIRKCFENESYSMYRKVEKEFLEIDKLKLSIAISGTKNQFSNLIQSSENGLFSRCCYYVFDPINAKLQFLGRMSSDLEIEAKFASFAKIANDYYELMLSTGNIRVVFSESQLIQIQEILQSVKDSNSELIEFEGNIKRAFVIALKIGAILTFLFECENGAINETINCSDVALNSTLNLLLIYLIHAHNAYELLPIKGIHSLNDSQQRLLPILPDEFVRTEGVQMGINIGLSKRASYYAIEALKRKGIYKMLPNGLLKKQ